MSYASYMRSNRGASPGPIGGLFLLPGFIVMFSGYSLVFCFLLPLLLMGLPIYTYEYYIKNKIAKEEEEHWNKYLNDLVYATQYDRWRSSHLYPKEIIESPRNNKETWFDTFIYICAMLFGVVWFIFLFVIYYKIFFLIKPWYVAKYY